MAYSATLIPHLEKKDAELHATKEETSWIGEIAGIHSIRAAIEIRIIPSRGDYVFIILIINYNKYLITLFRE